MNAARAKLEDLKIVDDRSDKDKYEAGYYCPRCGYGLSLVAEHAFAELWECAQCGYSKQVKQ